MDKYITRKRTGLTSLFTRFFEKLIQRPDYYPIRYYKKFRKDRYIPHAH
jgi:hypothetical protein